MPLEATVIIPTHDHGPMLLHSARSALAQTVEEIELFIVGDGVPEVTREIVSELKRDERVRFFDHPKGPRHGEIYRHAALQEARGEIVCYLSDDDLWFPEHVACCRARTSPTLSPCTSTNGVRSPSTPAISPYPATESLCYPESTS